MVCISSDFRRMKNGVILFGCVLSVHVLIRITHPWKTLWDTPTTDLGAESEPGDGGEHSVVAD